MRRAGRLRVGGDRVGICPFSPPRACAVMVHPRPPRSQIHRPSAVAHERVRHFAQKDADAARCGSLQLAKMRTSQSAAGRDPTASQPRLPLGGSRGQVARWRRKRQWVLVHGVPLDPTPTYFRILALSATDDSRRAAPATTKSVRGTGKSCLTATRSGQRITGDGRSPLRKGARLAAWYVSSRNRAALVLLHGGSST